jgi:hypothetical protein
LIFLNGEAVFAKGFAEMVASVILGNEIDIVGLSRIESCFE